MQAEDLEYVGFWPRVGAVLIDTILVFMVIGPILTAFYGDKYWSTEGLSQGPMDILLSYLFPAVATVIFWVTRQATPGKMAISAKDVDARTGQSMTTGQSIGRYFAYFVAMIPFMLGIIWVGIDARKQGWHDKLAGTVVVRQKKKQSSNPVTFESN
ncbi:RDD family protein [Methylophilus sp. Leaf408]|uniref:RDD family protein n=1 Tax=Methylophilus sp. Leaf408 TaxID=2876561 RepID=UPI001E45D0D1|nr:RDD family protein [Methylophilus sp. Leaf408]